MRFEKLDLNLLVAFDALMNEGGVTAAALKLNLSQSAMSSALARLRDFFGDELFVRTGRDLGPTALALELATPVHQVLIDVQANVIRRQPFEPAHSEQVFRLASSEYMSQVVVSDLSRHIAGLAPHVRLNVLPLNSENTRRKIVLGEIDFLLCPQAFMFPHLPQMTLFEEDFVVIACAATWPEGTALSRDQFASLGHVVVRIGAEQLPGLDETLCAGAGIVRRAEITIGAFDHAAAFVVGTRRIAIMQRRLALWQARRFPLVVMELSFENQTFSEVIQWQPFNAESPAFQWFRTEAVTHIRERFARA